MKRNKYNLKEFNQINELIQRQKLYSECFPKTKNTQLSSQKYYHWKFNSNLNRIKPFEYILLRNNEMVGYYAAIIYEYLYDNKKINAGMVCDVMVSPNFQREGLFSNLGTFSLNEMKQKGLDFTLGNPIKKYITKAHIKVGWENLFHIPLYIKFVGSRSILTKLKLTIFSIIFNFFLNIYNFILKTLFKSKQYKVNEHSLDEFLELDGIEEFYDKFNRSNKISLIKSNNFLRWRFSRPDKKYKFLVIFDNDKIAAYAIICISKISNMDMVAIVDLVSLDIKYIYSLIESINIIAKEKKIDLISIMLNKKYVKKYRLFNYGFLRSPYGYDFILNNLSNKFSGALLNNQKNWHISWSNFDDH